MTVGDKLLSLRRRRGITQETFAAAIEVSRSTVSKWELGHAVPNERMLRRIAAYYGVSPNDLSDESAVMRTVRPRKANTARSSTRHVGGDSGLRFVSLAELRGHSKKDERSGSYLFAAIGHLPILLLFLPVFWEYSDHSMHCMPLFRVTNVFAVMRPVTVVLIVLCALSGGLQLVGKAIPTDTLPPKKRFLTFGLMAILALFLILVQQPIAAILPIFLLGGMVAAFWMRGREK